MNTQTKPKRIILLDTLRGFLLILVILFHLCYDLNWIFGIPLNFMYYDKTYIFRDIFVSMLIFISGICCNLSHNNIRRGFKTLLCGLIITIVTAFFMPDEFISFGILHFFGSAMIIYGLFEKIIIKVPLKSGCLTSFILFFVTFNFYNFYEIKLGTGLTDSVFNYILFIIGFNTGCTSADYYPLIPWIFMFMAGSIAGRNIKTLNLPKVFYKNLCPPLTFIGRQTLWIYLVHQPVIYGILYFFIIIL